MLKFSELSLAIEDEFNLRLLQKYLQIFQRHRAALHGKRPCDFGYQESLSSQDRLCPTLLRRTIAMSQHRLQTRNAEPSIQRSRGSFVCGGRIMRKARECETGRESWLVQRREKPVIDPNGGDARCGQGIGPDYKAMSR
jgi:hypothetical protein